MELLNHAREHQLDTLRLALRREQSGLVLLGKTAEGRSASQVFPLLSLLGAQATTALALIGAREQSPPRGDEGPELERLHVCLFRRRRGARDRHGAPA
ncbi:MAG: hypothetical protein WDO74_33995 [Pseudomonadota bacterium]